ncbi:MAG: HAD family phosphatase [Cyanosarcina radialis HA8281-LM2]|nr:HAD family phosphatase [Cyanosarcina radialis HA8281-LM2]
MTLKAVLFDFNGTIINDEPIHQQLIEQILLEENLRPQPEEDRKICLGRSDRTALKELLTRRGRFVTDEYLNKIVAKKAITYRSQIEKLEKLPIYPDIADFIFKLQASQLLMAVVSGALRSEIEMVLNRAGLRQYFEFVIAGDDLMASKPEPDGYLLAVERLKELYPDLQIEAADCLAIEDTPAGIRAAQQAGMQVVGVPNTYPFHFIQRQADWAVDYLCDLEIDRVQQVYAGTTVSS